MREKKEIRNYLKKENLHRQVSVSESANSKVKLAFCGKFNLVGPFCLGIIQITKMSCRNKNRIRQIKQILFQMT